MSKRPIPFRSNIDSPGSGALPKNKPSTPTTPNILTKTTDIDTSSSAGLVFFAFQTDIQHIKQAISEIKEKDLVNGQSRSQQEKAEKDMFCIEFRFERVSSYWSFLNEYDLITNKKCEAVWKKEKAKFRNGFFMPRELMEDVCALKRDLQERAAEQLERNGPPPPYVLENRAEGVGNERT